MCHRLLFDSRVGIVVGLDELLVITKLGMSAEIQKIYERCYFGSTTSPLVLFRVIRNTPLGSEFGSADSSWILIALGEFDMKLSGSVNKNVSYSIPFKFSFLTVCQLLAVVDHARVEYAWCYNVLKTVEEGDTFRCGRGPRAIQHRFDVYSKWCSRKTAGLWGVPTSERRNVMLNLKFFDHMTKLFQSHD